MEKFKWVLKRIFFLPPIPTLAFALFGYTFIILTATLPITVPAVQYASYACSAYALVVTVTGFPHFLAFIKRIRQRVSEHPLMQKLKSTSIGGRYFSDVRFRSEVSLYQGLFINLLYIAMKLLSGIYYRSVWFIALAIYYLLLAAMRFLLLRGERESTGEMRMEAEIRRYRQCGIILLVMNQALVAIVAFIVHQNRGFDYPGLLIYGMALYAFYAIIMAVIKIVKYRRHGSPVMSAAKAVSFVAALVSMLSLTTAMLAQFGGDDEAFRAVMTASVGGGVCIIVIGVAVYMIWKSTKQLKTLKGIEHHG